MRAPRSTYRLQITPEFDLFAAAGVLSYLSDLGVDWVYLSPLLAAESDSEHGYDVADHSRIDPARGGVAGLAAVSSEARRLGMGVLVDVVPNHVGVANPRDNAWWWHVLTYGAESPFASAFDIDWAAGGGKLRLPVLGDEAAPGGPGPELRVEAGQLHYFDLAFPLAPGTADDNAPADVIHGRQHYELVHWKSADAGLNYRRFFAINSLAAVRVEEQEWFDRTHREIGQWFAEGQVDGLRIDHPDGLRLPGQYLDDLAELTGSAYVVIEKILALHEPGDDGDRPLVEDLPSTWATAGTTGYDAMALIDRVLIDPAGEQPLTDLESRLRGAPVDWHQMVHDNKREVADTILRAEILRIGREARVELLDAPAEIEDALAELMACFPVYRSYLPFGQEFLDEAYADARQRRPELAPAFDALEPVLYDPESAASLRFQQTTGMVMAKGVEDCSFYRYSRLTSLNEVGGEPALFSVSPDQFHAAMAVRQRKWPDAMVAGSTHDTKRGEDVRQRISVLAEVPELWQRTLEELLTLVEVPDPGFASLLWQAIIGAWPASRERLSAYAEKAMREAGDHTTWTDIDADYEAALQRVVDAAFDNPRVGELIDTLLEQIEAPGFVNAMSAKLISLTIPGMPDVYQGSELWEQSLVDPDNRRPVDYDLRREILAGENTAPGADKLALVRAALTARRDRPELFADYTPLTAAGSAADHVIAFDRGGAITVATRLPVGLARNGGWGDTTITLPEGDYVDALTGLAVSVSGSRCDRSVADLLGERPATLLLRTVAEASIERGPFDVWAPNPNSVTLLAGDREVPMVKDSGDWWHPSQPVRLQAGERYGYRLDDSGLQLPDPRSRRQPDGVHALSQVWDASAYEWRDQAWTGRQLAGSVIYELHLGTFTPEGTLDAAIDKLDHLVSIGVGFVELMPVNAFNGEVNWGYDGVSWFAVDETYGGPDAYQRFVDACHARGLGVIQDVVYNHWGPSGNYLPMFGPYLTQGSTDWGDQVNLDGEGSAEVRRYIVDNALMWLSDFHVDGLRLDAVHAIQDASSMHLLEELACEVAALSAHQRRPLTLIAESDLNDPVIITPREARGYGIDAQWSDDFHHAVHVALTGETDGYYADFEPLSALAKVMERGFFHDGTWSSFRERAHGSPIDIDRVPGWRLVVANQNHDQIGNRARGDRLTETLDVDQLVVAAMLTLTSPFTPMLFQGEEWAASTPFCFFTAHPEPELGQAVTEGRLREFSRMGWDPDQVVAPQDPEAFESSRLNWSEAESERHAVVLAAYRRLAELRRDLPDLTDPDLRKVSCVVDEDKRTFVMRRGSVVVAVNFSDVSATVSVGGVEVLLAGPGGVSLDEGQLTLAPHAGAVLR